MEVGRKYLIHSKGKQPKANTRSTGKEPCRHTGEGDNPSVSREETLSTSQVPITHLSLCHTGITGL